MLIPTPKLLLLLIAAALLLPGAKPSVTQAQSCGIKTDYAIYAEPPPPALPAKGGKFTDPTFCTTILRVTDASDGPFNATAYSYWPTFNNNNTRLFILTEAGSSKLYNFNATTFTSSNKRNLFLSPTPDFDSPIAEDSIWSDDKKESDVIYTHIYGMKLWSYNVATNTYKLVKDFALDVGAGKPLRADTRHLVQMSKSQDDDVFAFHLTDDFDRKIGYLAWRRKNNKYLLNRFTTTINEIDEVQTEKKGHYLTVKRNTTGNPLDIETLIVKLHPDHSVGLTDGPPGYGFGHSDMGDRVIVSYDNFRNRFLRRNLPQTSFLTTIFDMCDPAPTRFNGVCDWTIGNHVSMQADNESWALISTFFIANGLPSQYKFRNEIFLAETSGSRNVRRIAHTQSRYDGDYWASPRANISRDGKYVAFTSNWGVSHGRLDVFIVATGAANPNNR